MAGEHSNIIGGSKAAQRINCPGSYALEERMPKQPDSDFAKQGSLFHAAMELALTLDPGAPLDELVGQHLGFGEGWEITAEQIRDKIKPATDAFWSLVEEFGFDDWFIEQRVSLETVIPGAFGTCDVLAKDSQRRLWVIDFKFGDGVAVSPEGSYQLGFYAGCALYDEDEEVKEFTESLADEVVFSIIQPRAGANRVEEHWRTTLTWVEDLVDLAVAAVAAAQEPNAPIKPGSHCRWCSARPICPAHTALATDALTHTPSAASAVELAILLERANLLSGWVSDVFALAQRELENGAAIPGWKLVNKMPRRQWIDQALAEAELRKRFKVAKIFKRELISPTQAEKLSKKVYAKVLAPLVESKSSGLTIAEDSDKRDAVVNPFALLANAMPIQANGSIKEIFE